MTDVESRTIGAWTVRRRVTKANIVLVDATSETSGWGAPVYVVDGTVFLEHGEMPIEVLRAVVEMVAREGA